jgi:branched-chain amino acid transport system ATP-binding protein
MLSVHDLTAKYGALNVLFGVSFDLAKGGALALIGSNGAGKTTTFSLMTGLLAAEGGEIVLDGVSLRGRSARDIVSRGLIMVPEGRRLFPSLTVEENLLIGAYGKRPGPWHLKRVYELFPMLVGLKSRAAQALSGGQQQLVAIGRALMANPDVLLCDELSLGLSPAAVDSVYAGLKAVRQDGVSMILVEQDIARALAESDSFVCMRHGKIVLSGPSSHADRAAISSAYFGDHHD